MSRAKATGLRSCTLQRGDSGLAGRGAHSGGTGPQLRVESFAVTPQRGGGAVLTLDPHSLICSGGSSPALQAAPTRERAGASLGTPAPTSATPSPSTCPCRGPWESPSGSLLPVPVPRSPSPGQMRGIRAWFSAELYELESHMAQTLSGHSSFTGGMGAGRRTGPGHGPWADEGEAPHLAPRGDFQPP